MTAPAVASAPIAREPHAVYVERLDARRAAASSLAARERRLSGARLAVFLLGVAVAVAAFGFHTLSPAWLFAPLVAFVALVLRHDRVIQARVRADRAAAFYESGLARLTDAWIGRGANGERFADPGHLYAADLDLFGRGSLFERLCTARTRAGEETLARWLAAPATADEVRARQAAVSELRGRLDLREALALVGQDVRAGLEPEALVEWATASAGGAGTGARVAAGVLAGATALSLVAWLGFGAVAIPFLAFLAAEVVLAGALRRRVVPVVRSVERPLRDLALLAQLLAVLEAERFESTKLRALRDALDTAGQPPSRRVARLRLLMDLLDARRNQLFAPIGAILLWTTQIALAIEAWRREVGAAVPRWIEAVGEVEALCALAGFAFERPDLPFPEIESGPTRFDATALGHPLLPISRCVRNDLRLDPALRLYVVSGSNMSGKSTLLRSVGVNAVLALAGAPVCARALRLSPLSLGASIRIVDSLQEGASRFYAEITRLGQLVGRAESAPPLLFLLDEILAGTNSHDRRIGAEAVVRGLLARGGFGLVTTHDLALARIADDLAPAAANVHFEDQLLEGRMHFDFRLRPGVVERSNALALMRAVGLEVTEKPDR